MASARLACASAASSVTPTPTSNTRAPVTTIDINQPTGSNSMMDIDGDGFPVDHDCKSHKTFVSKTQRDVSNNTNLFSIVPITIEHINNMALVDSGSSFSALEVNFVNKYNIKINTNASGSVILAASNS
ncbi:hypothetical protein RMATCC62417_18108 [Rhizopus microsporus]|nr:hypothetical protein RMATCC62417_18108 [Rhizopus microsporus]